MTLKEFENIVQEYCTLKNTSVIDKYYTIIGGKYYAYNQTTLEIEKRDHDMIWLYERNLSGTVLGYVFAEISPTEFGDTDYVFFK